MYSMEARLAPATAAADPRRIWQGHHLVAWRIVAYLLSLAFAIGWTIMQGKDLHWDAINYHLYAGYSAHNDRFALDFFGAGTPAYLNPYAHVPLFLMWRAEWPALAMAIAFASFHAGVLWLVFEIAVTAGVRGGNHQRTAFALLAVVLTASNPVLLQGLGSTMTDPSMAVLVLAGWLGVTHALKSGRWQPAAIAGVLCGAATALKLSNAYFAVAAVPALLLMSGTRTARARGVLAFCVACGSAFVLAALPWSSQLWREFGNPFFPLFNEYFRSPEFITEPIKQERFVPLTWQAFVERPFAMLAAKSAVHVEPRAPDVRYVALLGALAAWLALMADARRHNRRVETRDDVAESAASRVLAGLLVGVGVAWCLWLPTSGNSRYFLPMACVASVSLALVLQRLYLRWKSATKVAILLLLGIQGVQLLMGTDLKRYGYEWEGPWLRVQIPERFREQPYFFLAPGFQSGSIFVPYLHPASGIMNVGGFHVIGPQRPEGARAQRLIESNADRLRFLLPLPEGVVDRSTMPSPEESLRPYFRRFGLRVDGNDCEFLRLEGNIRGERRPMKDRWKHFVSCRLVRAPEERLAYEREAGVYDVVFDRVEATCPRLFFPRRPLTQEFHYWSRTYHMGSEMQLFVDQGRVKYFWYLHGGDPIDIGSLENWLAGGRHFDCSVRTNPAVVHFTPDPL